MRIIRQPVGITPWGVVTQDFLVPGPEDFFPQPQQMRTTHQGQHQSLQEQNRLLQEENRALQEENQSLLKQRQAYAQRESSDRAAERRHQEMLGAMAYQQHQAEMAEVARRSDEQFRILHDAGVTRRW